jgi:hypothetical protein
VQRQVNRRYRCPIPKFLPLFAEGVARLNGYFLHVGGMVSLGEQTRDAVYDWMLVAAPAC